MKQIRFIVPLALLLTVIAFFSPFIFKGKLPIPSDTIIGLYHPFRDLYAKDYPNGIPYKNFLITDPVRQQIPWRVLAIASLEKNQIPLWNPYSFSGTPLLANMQTAVFYPFNILLFFLPFSYGWSILILLQPLLGACFMYVYLRNQKLQYASSFLGAIVFSFSGFSVAWMEWGTIGHTLLWLPLLLLSVDKIFSPLKQLKFFTIQLPKLLVWSLIFLFSLSASFLAGHLQTFFYVSLVTLFYILFHLFSSRSKQRTSIFFIFCFLVFSLVTVIQWHPLLEFIKLSARDIDLSWQKDGWFIPFPHLIQFLSPDFFGNPTTLNYWGTWNYGELVGYVGILPLFLIICALLFSQKKITYFFIGITCVSFFFALPTPIAKLPFQYSVPFLSTAQPTRLLALIDFSLAVLSGIGFEYIFTQKKKLFYPLAILGIVMLVPWVFLFIGKGILDMSPANVSVARHNSIFPLTLLGVIALFIIGHVYTKRKNIQTLIILVLIGISVIDLFRFSNKFLSFTERKYLFPPTNVLAYLQKNAGVFRIMTTDERILPPNFSVMYGLQSIDGYDPLYLRRYGELMIANERNKPDTHVPFGFNRIITPKNTDTHIIDLLGVKYILSLSDVSSPKLVKVFQEGQTRVYENKKAAPRTFFVKNILFRTSKQEILNLLFDPGFIPEDNAIIETQPNASINKAVSFGQATITNYSPNLITISTKNTGDGYLMLTDVYYPIWQVTIDQKPAMIYQTDYVFRGVFVPKGIHSVQFFTALF